MKNALRVFVPILFFVFAFGASAPLAFATAPTLNVYQTTLGSPSGNPEGNVYISGSDVPFLAARDAAIAGTLTNRTTYTPAESSVWGTEGAFGSELYMFSVIKDIPVGSLLKIHKILEYKNAENPSWASYADLNIDYPMIAYTHTTSATAYGYLTKFDCDATVCTFVTGAALAEDYSGPPALGSANTPPIEISQTIGFQFRHTIHAEVITGNYALTGASANRGYQQGTGYTGGDTPIDLGTLVNTSTVPNPTTVYIDPSYTTTSCGSHECYYDAFPTIQDGITVVATGGTIHVASGTYTETIPLNIDKNLTIIGAGKTLTTVKPANIPVNEDPANSSIFRVTAGTLTMSDLKIDGDGYSDTPNSVKRAIRTDGAGSVAVNNLSVLNIRAHKYEGYAFSLTSGTNTISNTDMSNIERVGVFVLNPTTQATVTGSSYIGKGEGDYTDNAYESNNAILIIDNSTATNCKGIATEGSEAAGVVSWSVAGAPGGSVTVTNSSFYDNQVGVGVGIPSGDTSHITISGSKIFNNSSYGLILNQPGNSATAINNWWGGVASTTIASLIFGSVNHTPWYTNSAMTTDSTSKSMTSFGFAAPSVTGTIDTTTHTVTVTVPNGTNVTGLIPTIATSMGANVSPASGLAQDFTNPVTYTVTSADESTSQTYTVTVQIVAASQTVPDASGDATISEAKPEVVITNPDQPVDVTIDSGTTDATIDVSSFVSTTKVDGGTVETGDIPQITITSTTGSGNAAAATIEIPATTVTGPSDWDGVIAAPTVTTVDLPATSGETKTLSSAIELGFADAKLTFSNAVRILLPNQAGKRAGYSRPGTDFTEITTSCGEDSQTWVDANLGTDGECKINASNGLDLVIWTKHFTTFATYTQTTNSTGGGGGGGYNYSYSVSINNGAANTTSTSVTLTLTPTANANQMQISNTSDFSSSTWMTFQSTYPWTLTSSLGNKTVYVRYGNNGSWVGNAQDDIALTATPATPAEPGVTPAVPVTPATGRGQVLGATTFNFTKALTVGVRSDEVTELQKVLIAEGLLKIDAPTGYFGKLTRTAVIAYQKARGIDQAGVVGPLTRTELNKGSVVSAVAGGKTNLSTSQADAIISIIESFGADASVVANVRASLGR